MSDNTSPVKQGDNRADRQTRFKKGDPRINRRGRPKGQSWQGLMKWAGDMPCSEALAYIPTSRKAVRSVVRLCGEMPLRQAIAIAVFVQVVAFPDASLLSTIMEREDGKVPQKVESWQDEIIALLRAGQITPDQVRQELGDELAGPILIAANAV